MILAVLMASWQLLGFACLLYYDALEPNDYEDGE